MVSDACCGVTRAGRFEPTHATKQRRKQALVNANKVQQQNPQSDGSLRLHGRSRQGLVADFTLWQFRQLRPFCQVRESCVKLCKHVSHREFGRLTARNDDQIDPTWNKRWRESKCLTAYPFDPIADGRGSELA
jgi:hypothetical protein